MSPIDSSILFDKDTLPVVVLEDSYPIRFRIKQVLENHGIAVSPVKTVREFFTPSAVSRFPSDIRAGDASMFIIGYRLKDGFGLDVVKRLKESWRWRNVPIILLSEDTNADIVVESLASGVSCFLKKPFKDNDLLSRVFSILGPSRMIHEESLPTVSNNLHDILKKEISRACRTETKVSLILGNISCLSAELNGQRIPCPAFAEDRVNRVIRAIRACFRDIDTLAPFGGGTFAIILPLIDTAWLPDAKIRIYERSQPAMVALEDIMGQRASLVLASASFPDDADDAETVLHIARKRLTQASADADPAGQATPSAA